MILAGGQGTRLREETEFRPKPMVEIGGRPILWHIMKHLSIHGVRDFVVALGYKGEMIKDYFLNYETRTSDFTLRLGDRDSVSLHGGHDEADWTVTLADTGLNTPTGGRILKLAHHLSHDPFLVVYGDGLSDVNVGNLINAHSSKNFLATVTITQPPSRYGVVDLDRDRVRAFQEKPRLDGWVNIGYFIFDPIVLSYLDHDTPLEGLPIARLAREGNLGAFEHRGFWQPMDTYREAMLLNDIWSSGDIPWLATP